MVTERLHRTLEELERLSPEAQDEAAAQLEALLHQGSQTEVAPSNARSALELIGAWSDIPWDAMEAELDRIRHESLPTPPIGADEGDDSSKAS